MKELYQLYVQGYQLQQNWIDRLRKQVRARKCIQWESFIEEHIQNGQVIFTKEVRRIPLVYARAKVKYD